MENPLRRKRPKGSMRGVFLISDYYGPNILKLAKDVGKRLKPLVELGYVFDGVVGSVQVYYNKESVGRIITSNSYLMFQIEDDAPAQLIEDLEENGWKIDAPDNQNIYSILIGS